MKVGDLVRAAGAALAAKVFGWWLLVPAVILALLGSLVFGVMLFGGGAAGGANALNASRCQRGGFSASAPGQFTRPADVTAEQIAVIKAIDEAVQEQGYGSDMTRLIAIAAMGESDLQNINYGDDINGVRNPDGTLTSSLGILQQQKWWGTVEERMDPKTAARRFILGARDQGGGLADVPGWQDMEETLAIHAVQKNRDPYHYAKGGRIAYVDALLPKAGIALDRAATKQPEPAPADAPAPVQGIEGCAAVLTSANGQKGGGVAVDVGTPGGTEGGTDTYPFTGIPAPRVYVEDGAGFYLGECTSYAMWKLAEFYGAAGAGPASWPIGNHKGGNGARLGNGGDWKAGWEARGWQVTTTPTANSVAWYGANSPGIGGYGHVAWVDKVEADGSFQISEYNNSYISPPGHKYAFRPGTRMGGSGAPQAFLLPPPADSL